MSGAPALVLVAHGSRDGRAAQVVGRAAARVRTMLPGVDVRVAFLERAEPNPVGALGTLADEGVRRAVVVPFLLTAAYHVRVDLPGAIRRATANRPGLRVVQAPALGPSRYLLDACDLRVRECGVVPGDRSIGIVLAAAGSSDPTAVASVRGVARWYKRRGWRRVVAGYTSQAEPTPGAALRTLGPGDAIVVTYLLAPGRFDTMVRGAAREAGVPVTAPLADTPEVASLVARRYLQTTRRTGVGASLG